MSYLGVGLPIVLSGCDSGSKGQKDVKRRLKGQGFKKVIVLGIDGLDPKIIEAMMEKGDLPNFQKLRAAGSFSRLATSNPRPVSC